MLLDFKAANQNFVKAIKANPNHIDSYCAYGNFLYVTNSIPQAIRQFKKAVEHGKNIWNCNGLGASLFRVQQVQQALEYLLCSIELNPLNSYTYYNVGLVLEKADENQKALWFFKKCRDLNPQHPYINQQISTFESFR